MKKTKPMKLLAALSAVLTGVFIALRIYLAFSPHTLVSVFGGTEELYGAQLTTLARSLFIISSVGILPLTLLSLWNAFTDKAGRVKSSVTAVLCVVFYNVLVIADRFFSGRVSMECARDGGLSAVALAGVVQTAYSLIDVMLIAVPVLLCLAGGAEFYAAGHEAPTETPSGEE